MPETMSVECSFCKRKFLVRSEQRGHDVRCPHCKILTKIPAATATASQAAREMSDLVSKKNEVSARRPARGGVRNKGLAIAWVSLLAVALIGAIVAIVIIYGRGNVLPEKVGTRTDRLNLIQTPDGTTPGATPTAPGGAPGTTPAATTPGSLPATPGAAAKEPIAVEIKRLLRGFRGETLTYAVGYVINNTEATIKAIKVTVTILDKDDKEMGEATAVLLNIPGHSKAPLVAEWKHEEGVRGMKWSPSYEVDPLGVSRDLPPVIVEEPWPIRDSNGVTPTGKVTCKLTNRGSVPLAQVDLAVLLVDTTGRIVGATRAVIDTKLMPNKAAEVSIPWDQCSGTLVNTAEAWAQAAR